MGSVISSGNAANSAMADARRHASWSDEAKCITYAPWRASRRKLWRKRSFFRGLADRSGRHSAPLDVSISRNRLNWHT
jgi:hypothetical protein